MNLREAERLFGLSGAYTSKDVKERYYSLAKQYHPDQNKNMSAANYFMQQINEARDVLEAHAMPGSAKWQQNVRDEGEQEDRRRREEEARSRREEAERKEREWRAAEAAERKRQKEAEERCKRAEADRKQALYEQAYRLIAKDDMKSLREAEMILDCDLEGWGDASALLVKCRQRLAQLEQLEKDYDSALNAARVAMTALEHEAAALALERLGDYKEARTFARQQWEMAYGLQEEERHAAEVRERKLARMPAVASTIGFLVVSLVYQALGFPASLALFASACVFLVPMVCGFLYAKKKKAKTALKVGLVWQCIFTGIVCFFIVQRVMPAWFSQVYAVASTSIVIACAGVLVAFFSCYRVDRKPDMDRRSPFIASCGAAVLSLAIALLVFAGAFYANVGGTVAIGEQYDVQGSWVSIDRVGVCKTIADSDGHTLRAGLDGCSYAVVEVSVENASGRGLEPNGITTFAWFWLYPFGQSDSWVADVGVYSADGEYTEMPVMVKNNGQAKMWAVALFDDKMLEHGSLRFVLKLGDTYLYAEADRGETQKTIVLER